MPHQAREPHQPVLTAPEHRALLVELEELEHVGVIERVVAGQAKFISSLFMVRRGMAGYLQPEEVESIRSDRAFQCGHPPRSPGPVGEEHVSVQTRLEECISLNSGGPQGPQLSNYSASPGGRLHQDHTTALGANGPASVVNGQSIPFMRLQFQ